ncbi:MAG: hypothetical protein ACP5NC_00740 [Nitrososphaeria archaeon]
MDCDVSSTSFKLEIVAVTRPSTDSIIVKIMGKENAGTSMVFANAISQIASMIARYS